MKKQIKMKPGKQDFFNKIYDVTKQIPYGKVTTYGHIAEACGIKSAARTVQFMKLVQRFLIALQLI